MKKMKPVIDTIRSSGSAAAPASQKLIKTTEKRLDLLLPSEIREFYSAMNGAELECGQVTILPLDEVCPVRGHMGDEGPEDWYAIVDYQDGNFIAFKLLDDGKTIFIDCFHETFGEPGFSTVVAKTFTELLSRMVESRKAHETSCFWFNESFQSHGDAFDYIDDADISDSGEDPDSHQTLVTEEEGTVSVRDQHRKAAVEELLRRRRESGFCPFIELDASRQLFTLDTDSGAIELIIYDHKLGSNGKLSRKSQSFIVHRNGTLPSGHGIAQEWESGAIESCQDGVIPMQLIREETISISELDSVLTDYGIMQVPNTPVDVRPNDTAVLTPKAGRPSRKPKSKLRTNRKKATGKKKSKSRASRKGQKRNVPKKRVVKVTARTKSKKLRK